MEAISWVTAWVVQLDLPDLEHIDPDPSQCRRQLNCGGFLWSGIRVGA